MTKSCGGGFKGQKFVPSTIILKVMSMSSWFCAMRSLKESVRSLLRLMSGDLKISNGNDELNPDNDEYTCEHALKLIGVFETAGFFEFRDHARFALV